MAEHGPLNLKSWAEYWNESAITPEYFKQICENQHITLFDSSNLNYDVAYIIVRGTAVLALDYRLKRGPRLGVALHGLSHHYMFKETHPIVDINTTKLISACRLTTCSYNLLLNQTLNLNHPEALPHIFAACGTMPKGLIEKATADEIMREYDFCSRLVRLRYRIRWEYEI